MATFTDSQGDRWSVAFTVAQARRMKSEHQVDINDPKQLAAALDDLYKRFDLLWMCCAPQAAAHNLTADDFDARISPTFAAACTALTEALTDFFRQCGQVRMVALLDRIDAVAAEVDRTAVETINSPKTDQALERVMRKARQQIDDELAKLAPDAELLE